MAALAKVLAHPFPKTRSDVGPLTMIAIFCGAGLSVSLLLAACGFDLGAGLF
jgi:hypothetical protein